MKWFEIDLERHVTDEIHSYVTLWKDLRIAPGNQKSQVRSWEKTYGLGLSDEKNTVGKDVEQIDDVPEQLKYLNEVTTSN